MLTLPDRSPTKVIIHDRTGRGGSFIYSGLALGLRIAAGTALPRTLWEKVSSLNNVSESSMVRHRYVMPAPFGLIITRAPCVSRYYVEPLDHEPPPPLSFSARDQFIED